MAVVLLNLVVQLLGCGLVLVRLFTNFAVILPAGIVVLQVNLESLAQPVLLNLVYYSDSHIQDDTVVGAAAPEFLAPWRLAGKRGGCGLPHHGAGAVFPLTVFQH